jgi:hypothetical protein
VSANIPQSSGRSNVRMALILGVVAIVFLGIYLYVHAVG